jgi:hypothetical protein
MPTPEVPAGEYHQSKEAAKESPRDIKLSPGAESELQKVGPVYLATRDALQTLKMEVTA